MLKMFLYAIKIIFWSILLVVSRSALLILSPLVLDSYRLNNGTETNATNSSSSGGDGDPDKKITIFFLTASEFFTATVISGIATLFLYICYPDKRASCYQNINKKHCIYNGIAITLVSLCFNASLSGYRIPSYLTGILANFVIPIQFIIRFIILRRKPTILKCICSAVIVLSEAVCLLPEIFPSLETNAAHKDDGGSTGPGRILWPFVLVLGLIPFAVSNTIIEDSVQEKPVRKDGADDKETLSSINHTNYGSIQFEEANNDCSVNVMAFNFWSMLCTFLTTLLFFWIDVIPGVGTCDTWHEFINRTTYDILCVFGQADCSYSTIILCWSLFVMPFASMFVISVVVKYSEGSSFAVVLLALRTPAVFIFWSLFVEHPFSWHPHTHLGTWLSIGALVVMLPSLIIYEKGDALFIKRPSLSEERTALLEE